METDQHSQENPDKMTPYEPVGGERETQIRYYECTFCKRGFSNAQALGGHMNIHKKQKSKLRLPSNETSHQQQQSLDVSLIAPHCSFLPKIEAAKSSNGITSSIKWHQLVMESDHDFTDYWEKPHVRAIQELPLFVDNPSSNDQQNGGTRKGFARFGIRP